MSTIADPEPLPERGMLRAGVGVSADPDTERAAAEAADRALKQAGLREADAALVFATTPHIPRMDRVRRVLREKTGAASLAGCSAQGIITMEGEVERGPAVAVLVLASEALAITSFFHRPLQAHGEEIGRALGRMARTAGDGERVLLLLPDTFAFQPHPMFDGVAAEAGAIPIVGGGASHDGSLQQTFLVGGDAVSADAVTGFLLHGTFRHTLGVAQACRPLGEAMVITRADKSLILELGGQPALRVLSQFLKEQRGLPPATLQGHLFAGFPLDPANPELRRGEYLVRSFVGLDPKRQAIAVAEEVTEGQVMTFALRHPYHARRELEQTLEDAVMALGGRPPRFGLYFNCCGRGSGLYGEPDADLKTIREHLGAFPLLGFFTFAEIAPIGGAPYLHNYTGVLLLVGDA